MEQTKSLAIVNKEINKELADPAIVRALLATTFKGLQEKVMRQAIFEAITRGFKLKDFLEGNVYAIPFGQGYSLVTSIKYANKIAQKNGVWVSGPKFEMNGKKIVSCSITAYKRIGQDIGEWTATVFFDEYNTGRNLWSSKPHTMIAKVCLSHLYRMACPEEMSQVYTEEEFDKEKGEEYDTEGITDETVPTVHIGEDHGESKPNLILDRTSTQEAPKEPEMPPSEEERLNLIKGLFVKKWPDLGAGMSVITKKVKDYCGVPLVAENYEVVINMLR